MSVVGRGSSRPTFFERLIAGEILELLEQFSATAQIFDPHRGRVFGRAAIQVFLKDRRDWLATVGARAKALDLTLDGPRELEEVDVYIGGSTGPATMPTATVIERDADGLIGELRIYFCAYYIRGERNRRNAILPRDPDIRGDDLIETYRQLCAVGDSLGLNELFADDSYVREPLGSEVVGVEAVRKWHQLTSEDDEPGCPLYWCAKIDDGQVIAMEYQVEKYGAATFMPISGIVVTERRDGKLSALRYYEEASPPLTA